MYLGLFYFAFHIFFISSFKFDKENRDTRNVALRFNDRLKTEEFYTS